MKRVLNFKKIKVIFTKLHIFLVSNYSKLFYNFNSRERNTGLSSNRRMGNDFTCSSSSAAYFPTTIISESFLVVVVCCGLIVYTAG